MSTKYLLVAVIFACLLEIVHSRRVSSRWRDPVRVLLVAGDSPCQVEGLVRYLRWEFSVRNCLDVEIAVMGGGAPREFWEVAGLLERDDYLVPELSGEPTLVFRL